MSLRPILLFRQSRAQNYGFTIEHVATYPPPPGGNSFIEEADLSLPLHPAGVTGSPLHTIVVSRVDETGIAAQSGIRAGDRVVAIEGVPVLHLSHKQAQEMVYDSCIKWRPFVRAAPPQLL
ncbi:hypothetical protein L596_018151 [Steinernema carpocapsae]|uniref:PDZ domain-containing protein n=1 Tax=Steinernema carpocapsae TaxID=34508 RepID=A0A4U5N489_STECR|nr:hypothetical protein L596_018151 [Steinernema carpocapsae]